MDVMDAVPKASSNLHRDTRTRSGRKYEQERLRTDVDKSCSEPEIHITSEFNPVVLLHDIALNKKSMHLKQSAVENNISNTSESSDEFEWPSDSSDEGKKSHLDSCDEGEMLSSDSSDDWEWLVVGDSSNDSGDSSDSSYNNEVVSKKKVSARKKVTARKKFAGKKNKQSKIKELSEYEKKIQEKRNEKLAFLQSLRMDEVKEDLNEAVRNLKPKRKYIRTERPKDPSRKSVRLANVHFDFCEEKLLEQTFGYEEEIKVKEDLDKAPYNPKRKLSSREINFEGPENSTRESRRLAKVNIDLYEEKLLARALAAIRKEFEENKRKRKIVLDESMVKEDPNEVLRNPTRRLSSREISCEGPESSTSESRRLAKVNFDLSEDVLLARALAAVRKGFQEAKDFLNEDTTNLKLESQHRKRERERIKRSESSTRESRQLAKVYIDLNEEKLLARVLNAIRKEFEENKVKTKAESMVKENLNEVLGNPTPTLSSREISCEGPESTVRKSCRLSKVNFDLSEEALLARVLAAVRKELKENKMKRKIEFMNKLMGKTEYTVKEDLNEVLGNPTATLSSGEISCEGPENSTRKSCRLANVSIDLSEEALLSRAVAAMKKEYKENQMKIKTKSMNRMKRKTESMVKDVLNGDTRNPKLVSTENGKVKE